MQNEFRKYGLIMGFISIHFGFTNLAMSIYMIESSALGFSGYFIVLKIPSLSYTCIQTLTNAYSLLDNKKESSFFEEIVAISCVCQKIVVPLSRFSRRVSGDCIRTRMILGFRI